MGVAGTLDSNSIIKELSLWSLCPWKRDVSLKVNDNNIGDTQSVTGAG